MAGGAGARPRRTSWWLIVKHEGDILEAMALRLAGGEEVLPVFSFEEEAELFLGLGMAEDTKPEGRWLVRETGAGELASLLRGPLSGVGRVALDPLPGGRGRAVAGLVSTDREGFVERLLVAGPRPREPGRGRRGGGPHREGSP